MEKLKPYFPILTWGPNYQKEYLIRDFIAGFTVALTVVPQVSFIYAAKIWWFFENFFGSEFRNYQATLVDSLDLKLRLIV